MGLKNVAKLGGLGASIWLFKMGGLAAIGSTLGAAATALAAVAVPVVVAGAIGAVAVDALLSPDDDEPSGQNLEPKS